MSFTDIVGALFFSGSGVGVGSGFGVGVGSGFGSGFGVGATYLVKYLLDADIYLVEPL